MKSKNSAYFQSGILQTTVRDVFPLADNFRSPPAHHKEEAKTVHTNQVSHKSSLYAEVVTDNVYALKPLLYAPYAFCLLGEEKRKRKGKKLLA